MELAYFLISLFNSSLILSNIVFLNLFSGSFSSVRVKDQLSHTHTHIKQRVKLNMYVFRNKIYTHEIKARNPDNCRTQVSLTLHLFIREFFRGDI
jgi:hypothetical protein